MVLQFYLAALLAAFRLHFEDSDCNIGDIQFVMSHMNPILKLLPYGRDLFISIDVSKLFLD